MLFKTAINNIKNSNNQAKFSLKKVINNKKKFYFKEKIGENKNNAKELWRTLKSLGMLSRGNLKYY